MASHCRRRGFKRSDRPVEGVIFGRKVLVIFPLENPQIAPGDVTQVLAAGQLRRQ